MTPYVPSEKTIPSADDRKVIDPAVDALAESAAGRITSNFSLIKEYKLVFNEVSLALYYMLEGARPVGEEPAQNLASKIYEMGAKYKYEGAFLGEFNYAFTRFIQRVPQIKVARGDWKETDELRYWLYAATISALIWASNDVRSLEIGLDGVFEDIKDEYKWKVNRAYEAAQIVKSGDCYYTPYYSRLMEVITEDGQHVGYLDILLKRDPSTLNIDVLPACIVVKSLKKKRAKKGKRTSRR